MSYRITTTDTGVLKGKAKANVAYNERKRIKITSSGPLATKGGAHGPIRTPYLETIANIKKLLSRDRATVIEVMPDGTEVQLTLANFCLDNKGTKVEVKPAAPEKVEVKPQEVEVVPTPAKAEEVKGDVKEETPAENVQESVQEKVEETKPTYNEYKKNKNKKNNHNNETVAPEVTSTTEA